MRNSFLILVLLTAFTPLTGWSVESEAEASANAFTFERRGEDICSVEQESARCFKPLAGYESLDLLAHVRAFQEKTSSSDEMAIDEVATLAAGFGLNEAQRRELLAGFAQLKVTDIAVAADAADENSPTPFIAKVEWTDRATPPKSDVILVHGRIGEDKGADAEDEARPSKTSATINEDLAPLFAKFVHVDRVANAVSPLGGEAETKRWLSEVVAPAAAADVLMVPFTKIFSTVVTNIFSKLFGTDADESAPAPNP